MTKDEKSLTKIVLIIWGIVLLFFCCSCNSKKNITQQSTDLTEETRTTEQSITTERLELNTTIKSFEIGSTIIYPKGEITVNADGSVQGEMDSVKINKASHIEVIQQETDTTNRVELKEAESTLKIETESKFKEVERSTNLFAWVGGVVLILFFIWIVYKVKSFVP